MLRNFHAAGWSYTNLLISVKNSDVLRPNSYLLLLGAAKGFKSSIYGFVFFLPFFHFWEFCSFLIHLGLPKCPDFDIFSSAFQSIQKMRCNVIFFKFFWDNRINFIDF
jgi:hypothetical protein